MKFVRFNYHHHTIQAFLQTKGSEDYIIWGSGLWLNARLQEYVGKTFS